MKEERISIASETKGPNDESGPGAQPSIVMSGIVPDKPNSWYREAAVKPCVDQMGAGRPRSSSSSDWHVKFDMSIDRTLGSPRTQHLISSTNRSVGQRFRPRKTVLRGAPRPANRHSGVV